MTKGFNFSCPILARVPRKSSSKVFFENGFLVFEKKCLEWFVTEGQEIEEFDELVEVQSDKATVPITSRYSGKVVKLHYDLEDVALVGQPLVDLEVEDDGDAEPVDHYEQSK